MHNLKFEKRHLFQLHFATHIPNCSLFKLRDDIPMSSTSNISNSPSIALHLLKMFRKIPMNPPRVFLSTYQAIPTSNSFPDTLPTTNISQAEHATWMRMYLLCIANFGIGTLWSLQVTLATPYFSQSLKTDPVLSHRIWIVSPLSGLIGAPIIGTLSDRCTSRWGRRRPFILLGTVSTLISMTIFSHSCEMAALVYGPGEDILVARTRLSIFIAVVSFSIMDLSMGITHWSMQALQGDLVLTHQQHDLQSVSVFMISCGDITASLLVNSFDQPVSMIRFFFFISAVLYASTVVVLLAVGQETPLNVDDPVIQISRAKSMHVGGYLRSLPPWIWSIGITHCLGFFMLFCIVPYTSTWFGSTVLQGDPSAPAGSDAALAYERGVRLSGKAAGARAFAQMAFSTVYPQLLRRMTPGQVIGFTCALCSILVAIFGQTSNEYIAIILVVVVALPRVAQNAIPAGCILKQSDDSNRGQLVGALNLFAYFSQLIDTMYSGYVSKMYGESVVFRIGAAWGLLTTIFGLFFMEAE